MPAESPLPEQALRLHLPADAEGLTLPLDWSAVWGGGGPNAIEIGTGNGLFLACEAARLPDWNFLGIEREGVFYWKMVRRVARGSVGNVRTTPADAWDVLRDWIPTGSVRRIYCYFSDPWPKRHHAPNRVVQDALLPLLERLLEPGGEFWFKTDVGWYFNLAVTVFRPRAGWTLGDVARLPVPDASRGEVITNFERKAREVGREVWGFHARWDGPADPAVETAHREF